MVVSNNTWHPTESRVYSAVHQIKVGIEAIITMVPVTRNDLPRNTHHGPAEYRGIDYYVSQAKILGFCHSFLTTEGGLVSSRSKYFTDMAFPPPRTPTISLVAFLFLQEGINTMYSHKVLYTCESFLVFGFWFFFEFYVTWNVCSLF